MLSLVYSRFLLVEKEVFSELFCFNTGHFIWVFALLKWFFIILNLIFTWDYSCSHLSLMFDLILYILQATFDRADFLIPKQLFLSIKGLFTVLPHILWRFLKLCGKFSCNNRHNVSISVTIEPNLNLERPNHAWNYQLIAYMPFDFNFQVGFKW